VGIERRLGPAKRTADANAAPLADWLAEWADDDGRPVHLFAHSLGARVTGATLRELADRGQSNTLTSVSLFGGAIPSDSVVGRRAIRTGYRGGRRSGIQLPQPKRPRLELGVPRLGPDPRGRSRGLAASATAPAGYADVDVTDLVADHYSYVEPEEGCLPRTVDRIGIEETGRTSRTAEGGPVGSVQIS